MLAKYGYTSIEVERCGIGELHKYFNQNINDTMDAILGKTILGFSDYCKEIKPDMIVVHGDRVEALAGATVGSLNNTLVSHIEGGEISGTIDELIRHAVSKMSHLHFVANDEAEKRLKQMGELEKSIYQIGSPDFDIMRKEDLPTLKEVKEKYAISFSDYSIVLFHPVTTDYENMERYTKNMLEALKKSEGEFVVIYPNNDHGSKFILDAYQELEGSARFKIFPSMRFEYFLTLLKNSKYIIGNSSAGVREAPYYGVNTVNIGNRQYKRANYKSIFNSSYKADTILAAIKKAKSESFPKKELFGSGSSDELFMEVLKSDQIWATSLQKHFIDL